MLNEKLFSIIAAIAVAGAVACPVMADTTEEAEKEMKYSISLNEAGETGMHDEEGNPVAPADDLAHVEDVQYSYTIAGADEGNPDGMKLDPDKFKEDEDGNLVYEDEDGNKVTIAAAKTEPQE